jgi:hypothetical protein
MKYVSPEYQERLDKLAGNLMRPRDVQLEFDLSAYAEVADVIIERPEIAQLGRTATFGWDSEGRYLQDER